MKDLDKILIEGLAKWNIEIDKEKLNKFKIYMDYLLEYNSHTNLTAIEDEEEIYKKHFLDSISVLLAEIPQGAKVIDVGTGAGFPSVPTKIMREDIDLYLLDSLNKRITFLEELSRKLNLSKVTCIHSRAEDGARKKELRQQFDYCVSRAVANLSTLLEYCTPFIKKGGYMVCLKGPSANEEIENAQNALKILNCQVEKIIDVTIPDTDLNHKIIIIKKIKDTPKTYPRKAGTPSKKPL